MRKVKIKRVGFGIAFCSGCGEDVSRHPVYFQVVKRDRSFAWQRQRSTHVIKTFCKVCAVQNGLIQGDEE